MDAAIQALIHEAYQDGLKNGVETLSGWRRTVYLVVEVDTYCEMEGLVGFYLSSVRVLAPEAAKALEMIGAVKSAQLINKVNAVLGNSDDPSEAFYSLNEDQLAVFDEIENEFIECQDERGQSLEDFVKQAVKE